LEILGIRVYHSTTSAAGAAGQQEGPNYNYGIWELYCDIIGSSRVRESYNGYKYNIILIKCYYYTITLTLLSDIEI
jgi:hypothetical protein